METGSRSSVRFKINNDLFGERHTDPTSDHKDPNPATLAPVSSGYQPCHNPVDLAKKANPCCESKNTSKNKIKRNSIEVTIVDV